MRDIVTHRNPSQLQPSTSTLNFAQSSTSHSPPKSARPYTRPNSLNLALKSMHLSSNPLTPNPQYIYTRNPLYIYTRNPLNFYTRNPLYIYTRSASLRSLSQMSNGDPKTLEQEKQKNLKDQQAESPHEHAPRWNEALAVSLLISLL